jgi:hypothetical protein
MITGSGIKLVFLTAAVTKIPLKIMVEVSFFISPPLNCRSNVKLLKGWYRQILINRMRFDTNEAFVLTSKRSKINARVSV